MNSTNLKYVLFIGMYLAIAIFASIKLPAAESGPLWVAFWGGEILFVGGIVIAAVGAGYSLEGSLVRRALKEGFALLPQLIEQASYSDLALLGLGLNWIGALLYPLLCVPISLLAIKGFVGTGVSFVLIVDIAATCAFRIATLKRVMEKRSSAEVSVSSERGANV